MLALHQANWRGGAYYAGQTWIENHEAQNLDARARRLVVLRATQSSAKPDVDALLAAVSTPSSGQTGWGLANRYRASPLDTALALDALRSVGAAFTSTSAIAYLKATQLSTTGDQGWAAAGGTTTDVYTTAQVVKALAAYRATDASLTTPLANALASLQSRVSTASPQHLRAVTASAYLSMDASSTPARDLLNSLALEQRADGGFDAGIIATGLIAQAFATAEGLASSNQRERVAVEDVALRRAINIVLGRGALDHLNQGELARLTSLDISGLGVESLEGLQYATNLVRLSAANNAILDLSPIAGLSQLTEVDLAANPCPDPICASPNMVAQTVPLPTWLPVLLSLLLIGSVVRLSSATPTKSHHSWAGAMKLFALLTMLGAPCYLLLGPAAAAAADETAPVIAEAEITTAPGLNPKELNLIRGVSRGILAAKRRQATPGTDADAEELQSLRTSLDALITAEMSEAKLAVIRILGDGTAPEPAVASNVAKPLAEARIKARQLATKLRQHGELATRARVNGVIVETAATAGLPVADQRARLFSRWGERLDAALSERGGRRAQQLLELRGSLNNTQGSITEVPLAHGTPTLQAMPWDYQVPSTEQPTQD